jgi:peptidoglycan hydrolase CwlO-like protein
MKKFLLLVVFSFVAGLSFAEETVQTITKIDNSTAEITYSPQIKRIAISAINEEIKAKQEDKARLIELIQSYQARVTEINSKIVELQALKAKIKSLGINE